MKSTSKSTNPKVAVLGSGNAGISLAGVLALSGVDVSISELPDFDASLRPILEKGGIDVKGEYGVGFAKPTLITTEIDKAIRGRKILIFCHPAYAHEPFVNACAPSLEDGQVLVFISFFGAMRMSRVLTDLKVDADVILSEMISFNYACDKIGPNVALVKRKKEGLHYSAFPATKTQVALEALRPLFPELTPAKNCLETSINNPNPWTHVAAVILNAGWIEATKGGFSFYMEGMTPAIKKLQLENDKEKMEVSTKLSLMKITNQDLARNMYKKIIEQTGGLTHQPKYYAQAKDAPPHLRHRYLVEDMIYGMVPVSDIGRQLGVPTPVMDATILIASIIAEMDFRKEGITAQKLGLAGLSADEMNSIAKNGYMR
jgi:opine dehydrogenase